MKKTIMAIASLGCVSVLCGCSMMLNHVLPAQESTKTASKEMTTTAEAVAATEAERETVTEKPTEPETTAAIVTTAEPTLPNDEWKEAYVEYIDSLKQLNMAGFALIDLDGNGIPELYFDSGFTAGGGSLSGYSDGAINTVRIGSGGNYYAGNHLCCDSGRMGGYTNTVYEVGNGKISMVFSGCYVAKASEFDMDNPDDFNYSYSPDFSGNFVDISYDEYNSMFSEAFDRGSQQVIKCPYNPSTIVDAIWDY